VVAADGGRGHAGLWPREQKIPPAPRERRGLPGALRPANGNALLPGVAECGEHIGLHRIRLRAEQLADHQYRIVAPALEPLLAEFEGARGVRHGPGPPCPVPRAPCRSRTARPACGVLPLLSQEVVES